MRCESEQQGLRGVEEKFDDAFAEAAEDVLRAGGVRAQRLDEFLIQVPALAGRLRAAKATLEGLRASYASLGAAGPSAENEMLPVALHGRLWLPGPPRIGRWRSKVADRLVLSAKFAERAGLDPEVIRGLERVRFLFDIGTRENTRRHDVGLSAELRRLVGVLAGVVGELNRKSRGAGRALFELVAFT